MDKKVDGKKLATLRLLKRIGIIGLSTSAVAIVLIAIFSFFPTGGGAFTIRLDNPQNAPHVQVKESLDDEASGTYFVGQPIKKAYQTSLESVYDTLSRFESLNDIKGSQNIKHPKIKDNDAEYDEALIHTVYLFADGDEAETVNVTVNLDGYDAPKNNVASPLEYLRIMLVTSEVTDTRSPSVNLNTTVYGAENNDKPQLATVEGADDFREAVSTYKKVTNEEGKTVRESTYTLNEQSYCEPFTSMNTGEQLVSTTLTIKPHGAVRFTFVSYFEGYDPQGYGMAPLDSYVLMSLHFGK